MRHDTSAMSCFEFFLESNPLFPVILDKSMLRGQGYLIDAGCEAKTIASSKHTGHAWTFSKCKFRVL